MSEGKNRSAARLGKGVLLPPPGQYAGTVEGVPALISVVADCVYAHWFIPRRKPHQSDVVNAAWDVHGKRFFPILRGEPIGCTVRRSSRVKAGTDEGA